MKLKILYLVLIFLLTFGRVLSYDKIDSTYNITITLSGGYSFGISKFLSDYSNEIKKNNYALGVRVQWITGSFLTVGFESGFLQIAELNRTDINAELFAYPFLILFTYNFNQLKLNAGFGYYDMYSKISDNTGESKSNDFEFGFIASVQYNYQLTKKFGFGAEVKFYNIAESSKSLLAIMANLNYAILEW